MSDRPCCGARREPSQTASSTIDVTTDPSAAARIRRRLVPLPGGPFRMGSEDPDAFPDDAEGPIREVIVGPFRIAPTTVTNAEFATFVKRTGYVTEAERFGWSFVFEPFVSDSAQAAVRGAVAGTSWWVAVDGAEWRHPEGPGSGIGNRSNHPVVHVSHDDALAYCAWSGTRLPSESEWEYAARGGLDGARFPWGDELLPRGRHMCNIWQGDFPSHNTVDDGHLGTAPVRSFRPNGYGLYNMSGNVWEWTADRWEPDTDGGGGRDPGGNRGGGEGDAPDKDTDGPWTMRGGSYLCHHSYCNRYRVAARTQNTGDSSGGNLGFRIVADH
jgi:sulfatase modifying factor 1